MVVLVLYYLSHVDRIYYLALHTALWRLDHAIPLTLSARAIWLATRTSESARVCANFIIAARFDAQQPTTASHTPVNVFFKWEILNNCLIDSV
jgi:hypothetical protein